MNRIWIIPVLAAVTAGVLAFIVTRHAVCPADGSRLDLLQDASFLNRELKLTDAQAREIKALHMTLDARLAECCERHCRIRARLGQALVSETDGGTQAEAIIAEMSRAYEESERATLDHLRQLRAVLNTEQRKRFDVMITNCLCRPCATCSAR